MADPLSRFGISRRPASEMFGEAPRPASEMFGEAPRPKRSFAFDMLGTPDVSAPGWGMAARRGVAEHQAAVDEELAMEDERMAAERQREAEAVADEYSRQPDRTARQKFFEERGDDMAESKRFGGIADFQKQQPSYADKTLANNIANKIDDPDERNVFLGAVSQGLGTLAAREEADRFRLKRGADARLAKLGMHPQERKRIIDEEGYDDSVVNYYEAMADKDEGAKAPSEAATLAKYIRMLDSQITSALDAAGGRISKVDPELLAERELRVKRLSDIYKTSLTPAPTTTAPVGAPTTTAPVGAPTTTAPVGAPAPVTGPETLEQKAARIAAETRKKYNID